jgi:hypothetical protein
MQDKSKASVILKNFSIDGEQEKLLAELSETIIPKTETPGAKDISAHLFVLKMMDDCHSKEDQDKFVSGLKDFQDKCKKDFDKSFIDCTVQEKSTLLTGLEKDKADNALSFFYGQTKQLTIQAYTSSQFYLTKVRVYELVPGRFHGCVPVTA